MTDLEARSFVIRQGRLVPSDIMSEELLQSIGEGKEILVTIRRPRNPKHHRLLWALLRKVTDNTDRWKTEKLLLRDLKKMTGLYEVYINQFTGEEEIELLSISFAAMAQDPFNEWFGRAIHVISTQVLHCDGTALFDEVMDMVEGKWSSGHNSRERQQ